MKKTKTVKQQTKKEGNWWIITISGYGSFWFEGNEIEAEEKRRSKARYEFGMGRKRLADTEEIKTGVVNQCKNHPNYVTKDRYRCECGNCK